MISYLCKVADVSRSGYYKYFLVENEKLRNFKEKQDLLAKENV